jgi:hypothetical protein
MDGFVDDSTIGRTFSTHLKILLFRQLLRGCRSLRNGRSNYYATGKQLELP